LQVGLNTLTVAVPNLSGSVTEVAVMVTAPVTLGAWYVTATPLPEVVELKEPADAVQLTPASAGSWKR